MTAKQYRGIEHVFWGIDRIGMRERQRYAAQLTDNVVLRAGKALMRAVIASGQHTCSFLLLVIIGLGTVLWIPLGLAAFSLPFLVPFGIIWLFDGGHVVLGWLSVVLSLAVVGLIVDG